MYVIDLEYVRISDSVKYNKGENLTLLGNIDNGLCLFVSTECIKIIESAMINKMTYGELLSNIKDDESRNYMKKLFDKLHDFGMLGQPEHVISIDEIALSIDITNLCNLHCKHCCVSAGDGLRGRDLPFEKLKVLCQKIAILNPKRITISGGEPLIRDDFKDISANIRKFYKGELSLMTNAILIDDSLAEFISKHYDSVDVSIDGIDELTCSSIRGEGVFEKVIKGITILQKYQCKIVGSMVLTKKTEKYQREFLDLCEKKLKIHGIVRGLDILGRGVENCSELECTETRVHDWSKIENYFRIKRLYKLQPKIFACQGAKREFQIDHRGEIFPCPEFMESNYSLGNILNIDNLKDYFETRKYMKSEGYQNFIRFHPYNLRQCGSCEQQLLCFGCAGTVKKYLESSAQETFCADNKRYYQMYWRYYEGN